MSPVTVLAWLAVIYCGLIGALLTVAVAVVVFRQIRMNPAKEQYQRNLEMIGRLKLLNTEAAKLVTRAENVAAARRDPDA